LSVTAVHLIKIITEISQRFYQDHNDVTVRFIDPQNITFPIAKNALVIPMRIGRIRCPLMIDTGMGDAFTLPPLYASQSTAEIKYLTNLPGIVRISAPTAKRIDTFERSARLIRIVSLEIGEYKLFDQLSYLYTTVIRSKSVAPDVIAMTGYHPFRDKIMTINYINHTLTFRKGNYDVYSSRSKEKKGSFDVQIKFINGHLTIPINVNGRAEMCEIDTGSTYNSVSEDIVPAGTPHYTELSRSVRTAVGSADIKESVNLRLSVSGHKLYTNFSIMSFQHDAPIKMIIGTEFLKDYIVTIDGKNALMHLDKAR
jgi:hypothetical protein